MVYPVGGMRVAVTADKPVFSLIFASTVNVSPVDTVPPVEPDGSEMLKLPMVKELLALSPPPPWPTLYSG